MDLDAILAALGAMENGEEMATFVKSLAGDITKKNNEAKNLRTRAKTAEDNITALSDKLTKLATVIGLDLEDQELDLDTALEAYKQKLTQQDPNGGKGQPSPELAQVTGQLNQLQRDLKRLTSENEVNKQSAQQEKQLRINLMRDNVLQSELIKSKVLEPDVLMDALKGRIKHLEDEGKIEFFLPGSDGTDLTVSEGIKAYLEAHPNQVANDSRPGSGSGGAGGKEVDPNGMSPEAYRAWRAKQ